MSKEGVGQKWFQQSQKRHQYERDRLGHVRGEPPEAAFCNGRRNGGNSTRHTSENCQLDGGINLISVTYSCYLKTAHTNNLHVLD